ncbi:MAG: 50S ribosomal protein L6 [Nitrospirae bacterium]|nr:MAG: 50S ribosomal protein L6 [Nitrospirota bacterium]
MSRIGRAPIPLPAGVEVQVQDRRVSVKGPLGQLNWTLNPGIDVRVDDGVVRVYRSSDAPQFRALHGLTRAEIYNHVVGVVEGYTRSLELTGVGYRAQIQGQKLILTVGYSHPVEMDIPPGVQVTVDRQTVISVRGIDKRLVTQVAANIRKIKLPDVYKQKGIRYVGEVLRKKAGKAGKK